MLPGRAVGRILAQTMSERMIPGTSGQMRSGDMLERLTRLRMVLPAMGQELASARREAAKLRVENGRLRDRLHRLEARASHRANGPTRHSTASSSPTGS
jgi:regulator of replication initiation timing